MTRVFFTDDTQVLGYLPIDRQVRIVQQDTSVRFGMVEVVAFIVEDSRLTQYGETMRKTFRDKELTFVLIAQLHAIPLTIGLAALPQIDRYIKYATDGAANEFGLGIRRTLKMQTAYHAITGAALVVLHKTRVNTRCAVTFFVVRFYEIPAGILEDLRLNDQ